MERLTLDTKILFCDISQCREMPGGSFSKAQALLGETKKYLKEETS